MASRATITFFHNPKCSTSRKAATLLSEASASSTASSKQFTVDTIEYLKNPLTKDQVKDILQFLDVDQNPDKVISEFLRKDAPKAQSVEQVQQILEDDPALMQRPLVVDWQNKKAVIGRPAEAVLDIVN
ncbi:hypothetical protein BG004_000832 [Podila humilis]|nr:hypothetical protein BG004_000832 [Podila humilis]